MNPPGISITGSAPLWRDYIDAWELTKQIHKYSHVIEAVGGYWSAQFTIRGGRDLADDWLQDGLGRHIEVFDASMTKIWEGFVNRLDVNYGPLAVTRGPLLDIANRVDVKYTTIEYDEDDNPVVGTSTTIGAENNTDSQTLWGIVPKLLSSGSLTEAQAEGLRDVYLSNNHTPMTGKRMRSDSRSDTSVMVRCSGYVQWLNWTYNDAVLAPDSASDKVTAILADTPNSTWLTYDATNVDSNALLVPAENKDNVALRIIKSICARGDSSNDRWLFGVYADREAHYNVAPSTLEYQQRLSQSRSLIERVGGDEVFPWNVLPGRWLMFPDFLIGQAQTLNLRSDPRAMFIERVKYTAPQAVELQGSRFDSITGTMARMGLSGVGA